MIDPLPERAAVHRPHEHLDHVGHERADRQRHAVEPAGEPPPERQDRPLVRRERDRHRRTIARRPVVHSSMLYLMAIAMILMGSWVIYGARKNFGRARRAQATATSFIGDLGKSVTELAGTVEIKGFALVGPEGTFVGPLSKQPAVWCRLHHHAWVAGTKNGGSWTFRSMAVFGVPFQVQDGSGARARVVPEGCVAPEMMAHVTIAGDLPPAGDEFFNAHRVTKPEELNLQSARSTDGTSSSTGSGHRYVEERIAPGDYTYLLGSVRRPAISSAPYREASEAPVIELFSGAGADGEMVLSALDEEHLRRGLRLGPANGYLAIFFGVLLAICNAIWWHQ